MLSQVKPIQEFSDLAIFWIFGVLTLLSISLAVALYNPVPLLVPAGLLFTLFSLNSPRQLFYLFLLTLPFSIEIHVGSIGIDLPSEPIMIVLMVLGILLYLKKSSELNKQLFIHPVSLLIIVHVCWIGYTILFSSSPIISLKYFLAKLWYVIPFYFLPLILFRKEIEFRKVFSLLAGSLMLAVTYVMVRHAADGFTFEGSNFVVSPIFRNHVNYAVMLVAFLPYLVYLMVTMENKRPILMTGLILYLIVAIYFSYTRAAQLSVFLCAAFYFVIKWRLVKLAIGLGLIGMLSLTLFLTVNNKYLDYSPKYERAIAHKKFDNLVEATAKMEDVSTVERLYRWIAGANMVMENPLTGSGPSTFYEEYKPYTVTSFKTYVSDNPERSGIHNNYLMVAVEQGIPGLIIMLIIAFLPLLYAERLYHKLKSKKEQALIMAAAISYFIVDVTILINDLLEADKVGPIFFMSAAIITSFAIREFKSQKDQARLSNN